MDHDGQPGADGARPDQVPDDVAADGPRPEHGGGDPVCWLERVCDRCGGLSDGPPGPRCERCRAALR